MDATIPAVKVCGACAKTKPTSEFWRHAKKADGLQPYCKPCLRERNRKWNRENRDRIREIQRRSRRRVGYPFMDDPVKMRARQRAAYAVKTGKLVKEPCLFCDSTETLHAHHHDYSRPLDVTWLCPTHHALAHGKTLNTETGEF